ncbi:MAG: hypothetical protein ACRDOX_03675 [Nocardioides sp.]
MPPYAACLIDVYDTVLSVDFTRHTSSLADLAGVDAEAPFSSIASAAPARAPA